MSRSCEDRIGVVLININPVTNPPLPPEYYLFVSYDHSNDLPDFVTASMHITNSDIIAALTTTGTVYVLEGLYGLHPKRNFSLIPPLSNSETSFGLFDAHHNPIAQIVPPPADSDGFVTNYDCHHYKITGPCPYDDYVITIPVTTTDNNPKVFQNLQSLQVEIKVFPDKCHGNCTFDNIIIQSQPKNCFVINTNNNNPCSNQQVSLLTDLNNDNPIAILFHAPGDRTMSYVYENKIEQIIDQGLNIFDVTYSWLDGNNQPIQIVDLPNLIKYDTDCSALCQQSYNDFFIDIFFVGSLIDTSIILDPFCGVNSLTYEYDIGLVNGTLL